MLLLEEEVAKCWLDSSDWRIAIMKQRFRGLGIGTIVSYTLRLLRDRTGK
jgi:hypothetical protein